MDIKYTADGKKVAVVGELNDSQFIVQEISVTPNGVELPHGDNFIVNELVDEPLQTWHEKDIAKWKLEHKKRVNDYNSDIGEAKLKYLRELGKLKSLTDHISKLAKSFDEIELERVVDFINGNIQYVVLSNHLSCKIIKFSDYINVDISEYTRDLKLLTLFGRTDGSLEWRVNTYSDGSGDYITVIPCKTHEDAVRELDVLIGGLKYTNQQLIDAKEQYGLQNPTQEKIDKFNAKDFENLTEQLATLEANKEKLIARMVKLKPE